MLIQGVILVAIGVGGLLGPAWDGDLRILTSTVGIILILAGAILAVRGIVDLREALTALPYPREGASLVDTGAYRLVRHPIYGGLIIGGFGWGLLTASPVSLLGALALFAFFDLKSRREEAWLSRTYEGYPDYRARTKKFFPLAY